MIELQLFNFAKRATECSQGTGGLTSATVVLLIRSLFGLRVGGVVDTLDAIDLGV